MAEQIVYTRSKPWRVLLDSNGELSDGRVDNSEGVGIHNFSKGIIEKGNNYDYVLASNMIAKSNDAKESGTNATGIFTSYEYLYNPHGLSIVGQCCLRPYNPSDVRPNGKKHRPGNHIKQYIISDIINYPCLVFGSESWDAAKKPENFYYHDKGEPLEFLPEIDIKYQQFADVQIVVREFLENGRKDCLKKLVSLVLSEMSKPISKRKFIVIKDTPENVEKWIAAVEMSLPLYLAKQISFSTNVVASSDLGVENTFYRDKEGKFISNIESDMAVAQCEKDYYFLIAGIHPFSQKSGAITADSAAEFWLLDGKTKSIGNNEKIPCESKYYDAIVNMDDDINDFNHLLEELKEIKFDNSILDIFEIFDGYKYLLDSLSQPETWKYDDVYKYALIFSKYEIEPFKWSQYICEKIYRFYDSYYIEDEASGFRLLKLLISMDKASKLTNLIEERLHDNYFRELTSTDFKVDHIRNQFRYFCSVYPSIENILLGGIQENIPMFTSLAESWNAKQSAYIFECLIDSFIKSSSNDIEWYRNENNQALFDLLFNNINGDGDASEEILLYIKATPLYLNIVIKGATSNFEFWSNLICSSMLDDKLEIICGAILDIDSISDKQYEEFLALLLDGNRNSECLLKFLIKSIEKNGVYEGASLTFVKSYLNKFGKNASKLKVLVNALMENDLGEDAEGLAYDFVDQFISSISYDKSTMGLVREFDKWRIGLKRESDRAYTLIMIDDIAEASSDNVEAVIDTYLNSDLIPMSESDALLLSKYMKNALDNDRVLVKSYKILKDSTSEARLALLNIKADDPANVVRFIDLILGVKKEDWRDVYHSEISKISEDYFNVIKSENIDKIEKSVIKYVGKDAPLLDVYKQYFSNVKERIRATGKGRKEPVEDTVTTPQKATTKESIFSKIFKKNK